MSLGRRLKLAITGFALPLILFALSYAAQYGSARQAVPQPLYHALFPQPTGKNGYEEFVQAEELFTSSPIFAESERIYGDQSPKAIDAKRMLLIDPITRQVLSIVRAGLKKPTRSPRSAPELYTLIPELRDFRAIARLMCAQMDVHFADGNSSEAIDCLDEALRFGRAVQVGTLMSGVVGLYIENTALKEFADQFGELSAADCDKLAKVARRHLKHPDPQKALLTAERDMFLRTLENHHNDASGLLEKLDPGPNVRKSVRQDFTDVCRLAKDDPEAGLAMLETASALVNEHFRLVIHEVQQAVWTRNFLEQTKDGSPASKLVFSLFPPNYTRLNNRFESERLSVQTLFLEANIERYQRNNGHTPDSLGEMKLDKLAIDPFSGKQMGYERTSDDMFTLSSVGHYEVGELKAGSVKAGSRTAIIVNFPPQK